MRALSAATAESLQPVSFRRVKSTPFATPEFRTNTLISIKQSKTEDRPFPEPYAGLVIRYSYLWKREHETGREEGTKDRPCANTSHSPFWITITHSPPPDLADAIEIPTETKKRLGLDTDRSWIMITEANEFLWPGPDLRPVPGDDASTIAYGPLPPRFFAQVRDKFLERHQSK
jgi:hypothetical protein